MIIEGRVDVKLLDLGNLTPLSVGSYDAFSQHDLICDLDDRMAVGSFYRSSA
jgi:hypothetical protein